MKAMIVGVRAGQWGVSRSDMEVCAFASLGDGMPGMIQSLSHCKCSSLRSHVWTDLMRSVSRRCETLRSHQISLWLDLDAVAKKMRPQAVPGASGNSATRSGVFPSEFSPYRAIIDGICLLASAFKLIWPT